MCLYFVFVFPCKNLFKSEICFINKFDLNVFVFFFVFLLRKLKQKINILQKHIQKRSEICLINKLVLIVFVFFFCIPFKKTLVKYTNL